jgi:hypothetical protein
VEIHTMPVLAIVLLFSAVTLAQSARAACSMGPDAEREYHALPSISDLSLSWDQRYGPWRTLARKYPNDWALQLRLQEPIRNPDAVLQWDRTMEFYHSVPDHVLRDLLEGRLVMYRQPARSREALLRIAGEAGNSPWAHFALLESAADAHNGDPALAEREYLTFRRLCPGERLVFRHIGVVRDRATLNTEVKALRAAIESAKQKGMDEDDYHLLQTAWTFERATYGHDDPNQFRNAVISDVAYLRDHPRYESLPWFYLVSSGYRRELQDSQGLKSLYNEVLKRAALSHAAYDIYGTLWSLQNPPPQPPRPEPGGVLPQSRFADGEAYRAKQIAFLLPLIERFWGRPYAAADAWQLLSDPGLSAGKFERLADFVLSDAERNPDQQLNPVQLSVAESYIARKIRLDRVPALIAQAVKLAEAEDKYRGESGGNSAVAEVNRRGRQLMIEAAIGSGQMEQAKGMLRDYRRELDMAEASTPDDPKWQVDESVYQTLANQLGIEAPMNPAPAGRPRQPERVVTSFNANDLSGRAWSEADLKGKVTYVATWRASACRSCAANLEGVQALYERWKNRSDRAVLTISMDENAAIPEAFMKENGYSFPVIVGRELARSLLAGGWPLQWFIDPQGRRRRIRLGPDDGISKIEEMADNIAATQ